MLVTVVGYDSAQWGPSLGRTLAQADAVVVVDNASHDATADVLAAALPRAEVLRLPVNVGFGAAHNRAVERGGERWAERPYVLLLNPDCTLEPGALEALVEVLDANPRVGAVSPQLVNADGSLQGSARPAFFREDRRAVALERPGPTEWLRGSCLVVRRSAWREVGGFDPRYFLFYEDDDLCLRLQRAGWACWLVPHARAVHVTGTGSAFSWPTWWRKNFHLARSKRLALSTWVGAGAGWRYRLSLAVGAWFAVPLYLLVARPRLAVKWAAWGWSVFADTSKPWV